MIFMYFDPDIWGTVSDWIIVIVTVVTAFYLYKTLQSQKDVQETQNKLFEIETIRFRESIKPVLKYSISKEAPDEIQNTRTIFNVAVINETVNIALEIRSDHLEKNLVKQVFAAIGFPKFHLKKDDEPWFLHFVVDECPTFHHYVTFLVSYKDISGITYRQGVLMILNDTYSEIHPYPAEIIN